MSATQQAVITVRAKLALITFPGLSAFSAKDGASIINMFRWLTLYRNLLGVPLPKPTGTLLEIVLMLDLFSVAWNNRYSNDVPIDVFLEPIAVGDLSHLIMALKQKALRLDVPKTTDDAVYLAYAAQRKLGDDAIPSYNGTLCERYMLLELAAYSLLE